MKKFLPCLTAVAVLLALASCKTEESNHSGGYKSISGVIQEMPTDADEYVLKAIVEGEGEDLIVDECVVGASGSFTIDLPATIGNAYLESYEEGMGEDAPVNLNVSNPNVKIAMLNLKLFGDGEYVDDLEYSSLTSSAIPLFSNAACKITGNTNMDMINASVNIDLVSGWNWMVASISITSDNVTASLGSKLGSGLKWYLEGDFNGIFN